MHQTSRLVLVGNVSTPRSQVKVARPEQSLRIEEETLRLPQW
jgi:hypothetical protein